jgi:plastocyanin
VSKPVRLLAAACLALGLGLGGWLIARDARPADIVISTAPGETMAFEPRESAIAAASSIKVAFVNRSTQAHNLTFIGGLAGTRTIVDAGTTDAFEFLPPGPGRYAYQCTIHPGMEGALVVTAAASVGQARGTPTRGRMRSPV